MWTDWVFYISLLAMGQLSQFHFETAARTFWHKCSSHESPPPTVGCSRLVNYGASERKLDKDAVCKKNATSFFSCLFLFRFFFFVFLLFC